MCKDVQMLLTPSNRREKISRRENKSPFHDVGGCVAWSQVARLTRCPRHRLVQPSRGRGRSIVCICGWPNTKALERTPRLSWNSEDCAQRCYWHYSKWSGFFKRVMTTHVAFNRSCSFLRILSPDKKNSEEAYVYVSQISRQDSLPAL